MRNSTCKICFKEFKAREGKLYCSNACKQRGFMDKKIVPDKINQDQKEEKPAKRKFEFYFKEYQEYLQKYPNSFDSFFLFCFFRKNLEGTFDPDQFKLYLKSFPQEFWDDFWDNEDSIIKRKFNEFEAKCFSDDVSIHLPENNS